MATVVVEAGEGEVVFIEENSTISLPASNSSANPGPTTPIVRNDIAEATTKETGTVRDLAKTYAEIQLAHTKIGQTAAGLEGSTSNEEVLDLIEDAKEKLAEKKAEITNKWGGIYGYSVHDQTIDTVKKPKGLGGASTTQEQQLQYIQYMLQTPLAPVVDTTHVSGRLTPSIELAQRALTKDSGTNGGMDEMADAD
ncbi:hypothetical protein ABW20_dc0102910 [Dactylellina cionopaga]|nr:hypothetical protein ABW20_dc0102910 [Dactylellina cionopaga]